MMDPQNPFTPAPPPGGEPNPPEWCLLRQLALLMILAGFALFIWSL
jgi:hypothetical protein